jgi:hypothetical protein
MRHYVHRFETGLNSALARARRRSWTIAALVGLTLGVASRAVS